MRITPEEGRVVGCLVEKQLTTPQLYPLTDNALIAACNQTTSRDPVVSYDLTTVRLAVRSLREKGLLRTVHRLGERSDKHQHELPVVLELSPDQVTVLAVLLLRGPQTAAELRARTERMHPFGSVEEVEQVLAALVERELAERLPRQPGRREDRFAETLVEEGAPAASSATDAAPAVTATALGVPPAAPPAAAGRAAAPALAAAPVGEPDAAEPDSSRLDELAEEVALLREEVAQLREKLEELTG